MRKRSAREFCIWHFKISLKFISACAILDIKKDTCVTGAFLEPHSKGGASQNDGYLLFRGARPGSNRAGIFIYAYFSDRER